MKEITKKSWREVIPPHPAADLFPMMNKEELIALGNDIKKNGLLLWPVIWEAEKDATRYVLDGRNRLDAMEAVGLPVLDAKGTWLDEKLSWSCGCARGGDPYAAVLSLNIHRRHLTVDQKRELITKVLKATPEKSNRQIAKAVGVSHPHVGKIRTEMESAGDVETVSTSIDTKGRRQHAKRGMQPKTIISSFAGVSEVPTTPEKLTSGLPTGSPSQKNSELQAAIVEMQAQPAISEIITSSCANEISKLSRTDQIRTIRAIMEKLRIGIRDFADDHLKFGGGS